MLHGVEWWPTPTGGSRTATRPRSPRGSRRRTNAPGPRSTPGPTAGRGWPASSACSSCPSRRACRLAGDRVFSLERGGGQKQLSLVVRPVDEPAAAARLLVDPAALVGRRGDGHRLVPPVARRPARRLRRVRGRRRAQRPARPRRRDPEAPGRRDPRDPRRQRGVVAGRHGLPLLPLPGGRSSTTGASTATASASRGPTTSWCGPSCPRPSRGPTWPPHPTDGSRSSRCSSAGPGPTSTSGTSSPASGGR